MSDHPENPLVFPQSVHPDAPFGGMTLRDYFAGQALAGDMAAQSPEIGEWTNDTPDGAIRERVAIFYRFADAMLRERGK